MYVYTIYGCIYLLNTFLHYHYYKGDQVTKPIMVVKIPCKLLLYSKGVYITFYNTTFDLPYSFYSSAFCLACNLLSISNHAQSTVLPASLVATQQYHPSSDA